MKNNKILYLVQLSFLSVITILVAATPLGYITLGPLSFTIMVLPVAIGSLILGMPAGIFLGLIFGITSFIKAPTEALGILLLSYSLPLSLLICIVPRVMVGVVASILGKLVKNSNSKNNFVIFLITGFLASATNTILFVTSIDVFCGELIKNEFGATLWSIALIGGIIEAFANAFLTAAISTPIYGKLKKQ